MGTPTPALVYTGAGKKPTPMKCNLCHGRHTHMYNCEQYIQAPIKDRKKLNVSTKSCYRCLRLDAQVEFTSIEEWWSKHKNDCRTNFTCKVGKCQYSVHRMQKHILVCATHGDANAERMNEFKNSLPVGQMPNTSQINYLKGSVNVKISHLIIKS